MSNTFNAHSFIQKVDEKSLTIGVIGLGYVGLPLLHRMFDVGLSCIGFDIDETKIDSLKQGRSYIGHIPDDQILEMQKSNRVHFTSTFAELETVDAVLICVPTPLTKYKDPDMSYVLKTCQRIKNHLKQGQLIVLESTTFPGTVETVMKPILEESGLKADQDFFLAFSPEREDPCNPVYDLASIPKVVGADNDEARAMVQALYQPIVKNVIPVSDTKTAEAVKLTENIFRCVNIALINELKVIFNKMGIDVWEVIEAAKTKPFGFMPFYPGPGLGGHCIPIDPFYLTWRAKAYEISTKFIELAGQINTDMPFYVIERLSEALDKQQGIGLSHAKVLVVGLAYKKNVDDMRESPSLKIFEILEERKTTVDYYDPYIETIPYTREHAEFAGKKSIEWNATNLAQYDVALICTDHDSVDYAELVKHSKLIVDTRNATKDTKGYEEKIVKA